MPGFEGYYPLVPAYGVKRVHSALLTLQILFVVINGLIAWLVLDHPAAGGKLPEFRHTRAIGLFMLGNFALLSAFPPFESHASLAKFEAAGFDGFHFALGDKRHRHFFIPLLYLEVTLVVVNALVVWLLFNSLRRTELFAKEKILELAQALPPGQRAEVSQALSRTVAEAGSVSARTEAHLGAGQDRRKHQDPRYRGSERRKGGNRRLKARPA